MFWPKVMGGMYLINNTSIKINAEHSCCLFQCIQMLALYMALRLPYSICLVKSFHIYTHFIKSGALIKKLFTNSLLTQVCRLK